MQPASPKPTCEQIIDILPEPFVVVDRDYNIIAANHNYTRRFEMSSEQIVGRKCYEVSHRSSVPCSQHGEHCPLETVFQTGQATQVLHVHYDTQGREEYVQLQANPILDTDGRVMYMGEYIHPLSHHHDNEMPLVGNSPALMRTVSLLQRVAPTQTTVLLLGESGSGKECVAQYLHKYSRRSKGPLVVVDCATLGEALIESELFGHEKGAFTGAGSRKKGLFEAARGGTLFIDEIGELPLSLQTKLLRVLETGTIRRIGGTEYIPVDVRVVAATHRNLQEMVERGTFRQDLYYRLSAFPIRIPTLRERKDDIPALAEHFLMRIEDGDRYLPLSPEVIETLLLYDYPGNVRELRNIIERAAILAVDDTIQPQHIVMEGGEPEVSSLPPITTISASRTTTRLLNRRGGRLEESDVMAALEQCDGHRGNAARLLGVSERTLYRYVQKLRHTAQG